MQDQAENKQIGMENTVAETGETVSADMDLDEALAASIEAAMIEEKEAPASQVSDLEFETMVVEALHALHGRFLFKMRIEDEEGVRHVATGMVGQGSARQFLVLTLPERGGELKVENAVASDLPVARITEAYAGVMDALKAAA